MLIQVQIKKSAGSSSYISTHLFIKFSNTSVSNNVSLSEHIDHDNQLNLYSQSF